MIAPITQKPFILDASRARAFEAACGAAVGDGNGDGDGDGDGPQNRAALLQGVFPMAVAIGTLVQGVQPLLWATLSGSGDLHGASSSVSGSTSGNEGHITGRLRQVMHREESLRWHAPLALDTPYRIAASLLQHEQRAAGAFLRIAVRVLHPDGAVVASSESLLFVRPEGHVLRQEEAVANPSPQRPAAYAARALRPWRVPEEGPERYARASLETNPIHLSDAEARRAGLPKRILHGMCTLSFAARMMLHDALQRTSSLRAPQLRAIKGRFVRPVFCGDVLTCRVASEPQVDSAHPTQQRWRFDVVQQHGVVVLSRGEAILHRMAPP